MAHWAAWRLVTTLARFVVLVLPVVQDAATLVVLSRLVAGGCRAPRAFQFCPLPLSRGYDVSSALVSRHVPAPVSSSLDEQHSAWVVPVRGHPDSIARLMAGDQYIGRGCRQRSLERSQFCNPNKVCEYGRVNAIRLFEQFLDGSLELSQQVQSLTGKRFVCHCTLTWSCHADALIRKFMELHLDAFDRNAAIQRAPTADELNLLARHRQELPSDDGSSADEGVPGKNSGWVGVDRHCRLGSAAHRGTTAMARDLLPRGAVSLRTDGTRVHRLGRKSRRGSHGSQWHA